MPAKRGSRPGVWEAEAIQDLFRSKTLRDSFKEARLAEERYNKLCEYVNEPFKEIKSKHMLHAVTVFYLNSCESGFETKVMRGTIGGLSEAFVRYAFKTTPDGTALRSLLERAFNKYAVDAGCAPVTS